MSTGGSTTSNTVSTPWTGQQPYLSSVMSGAQNAYNQYASNPSSSVANFTPMQNQAMGMTQDVANGTNMGNASSLNNAAGSYTNNLMNGDYLNSNPANSSLSAMASNSAGTNGLTSFANGSEMNNPYMQGMANAANTNIVNAYQTATAPQTTSEFEGSGRYGSGAMMNTQNQMQQGLTTQLANAQNNLYGSMYNTNEANQLSGAQSLAQNQLGGAEGLGSNYNTATQQQLQGSYNTPSLVSSINGAAANLYGMGGNQQALAQTQLNSPFTLLNDYSGLIQGNYGGTTSTTQPYYTNPIAGGLGGAASGAAIGSMIDPGLGTGIGAGLGGLLGLL